METTVKSLDAHTPTIKDVDGNQEMVLVVYTRPDPIRKVASKKREVWD